MARKDKIRTIKVREYYCQLCGEKNEGFGNAIFWQKDPRVMILVCNKCFLKTHGVKTREEDKRLGDSPTAT